MPHYKGLKGILARYIVALLRRLTYLYRFFYVITSGVSLLQSPSGLTITYVEGGKIHRRFTNIYVLAKLFSRGEFETLSDIRKKYQLLNQHYIPGKPEFEITKNEVIRSYEKGYKPLDEVSQSERKKIAPKVKEFLDDIHREGIIHGDLELKNILLDSKKSRIFVIDWENACFSKDRKDQGKDFNILKFLN
ncbi:MAG: phosphotransferase [Candidatus Altiarchaeota archaeon]|nr:phosphotransferase [Candidatus Altiarchaeota archaeon]